jgi:hypothetical protein
MSGSALSDREDVVRILDVLLARAVGGLLIFDRGGLHGARREGRREKESDLLRGVGRRLVKLVGG